MFNPIRIFSSGWRAAAAACLLGVFLTFSSCVTDDYVDQDCVVTPAERPMYVKFKLSTASSFPSTRALADDGFDGENHPSEESLAAESFIDVKSDCKVFLFSNRGGSQVYLQELEPSLVSGFGDVFTSEIRVSPSYLLDASESEVSFTIVVLAGWRSVGADYPVLSPLSTTKRELEDLAAFTFTLSDDWSPEYGRRGIPMYGYQDFSGISLSALAESGPLNPLLLYSSGAGSPPYCRDIPMLRSLAKFEVADNIDPAIKDADGYPRLESVRIVNSAAGGLFIPRSDSFNYGFSQVFRPSLPASPAILADSRTMARIGAYSTSVDANGNDWDEDFPDGWWSLYIPEMRYAVSGSSPDRFSLEITVALNPTETQVFRPYVPQFVTSEGMILRNHVYRVTVSLGSQLDMELSYTVCPWDSFTIDIPDFE